MLTHTLFTNLNFVVLQKPFHIRLHAHALLLNPPDFGLGGFYREQPPSLCGFGSDAALPVFTLQLKTMDYKTDDAAKSDKKLLSHDGSLKPIFHGSLLEIGELEFFLQAESAEHPLCIDKFEEQGDLEPRTDPWYAMRSKLWDTIWATLNRRVPEFWRAPYFIGVKTMPVSQARRGSRGGL